MTNKQILVLNKIADVIRAIPGIAYVGLYPEAVGKIGQRYPAVIIMDSDESAPAYNAGQEVIYDYQIDCILHTELRLGITRIADVLDLQNKIITAIITDLSLANYVHNITGHSVSKGETHNVLNDTASGYQGEITTRTITFNVQIRDTRL
jgi:hypothetical protein